MAEGAAVRRGKPYRGKMASCVRLQLGRWVAGVWAVLGVSGCMQSSRVDDAVTAASLTSAKKAVAVMRVGSASPTCLHVGLLLGVRDGDAYKRHSTVTVANVRSITETPVAEVELDPGEYHVIGYSCVGEKGPAVVTDSAGGQLYRTSFAHFALSPGEIINVGYFHFGASQEGRSVFGRGLRTDVEISEWPLAELERFKIKRPAVYAQMKTRLMVVNDAPSADELAAMCRKWAALKAEGKAQDVPPACGGAASQTKRRDPKV